MPCLSQTTVSVQPRSSSDDANIPTGRSNVALALSRAAGLSSSGCRSDLMSHGSCVVS